MPGPIRIVLGAVAFVVVRDVGDDDFLGVVDLSTGFRHCELVSKFDVECIAESISDFDVMRVDFGVSRAPGDASASGALCSYEVTQLSGSQLETIEVLAGNMDSECAFERSAAWQRSYSEAYSFLHWTWLVREKWLHEELG